MIFEKKIAIQGLFRTGTNFTKSILENNYHCQTSFTTFGWKHSFIPELAGNQKTKKYDLCILVTKNPFSFLVSLFNYHVKEKMNIIAPNTFDEFLSSRIIIYNSHNPDSQRFKFKNPIEMWNQLNFNFLHTKNTTHICYEDLINSPQLLIEQAVKGLNLRVKNKGSFVIPSQKVKRLGDSAPGKNINDYTTKDKFNSTSYQKHAYMKEFSTDNISFILSNIDFDLVEQLDYKTLITELTGS